MTQGGIRTPGLAALLGALLLGMAPGAVALPPGPDADGTALLARFAAAFAPDRPVPPTAPATAPARRTLAGPDSCGTPLIRAYLARRDRLPPATVRAIDGYLSVTDVVDTLYTDGGHFRLGYTRTGDNAVPLDDADPADGTPDFVARVAGYLDAAWTTEFDEVGLLAPPTTAPIDVSFRRMHFYGYTVPVDQEAGTTRLVLNNAFTRFPPNDDPDGDVAGAARVTAAHELRHASQYAGSRWCEGDWTEMDAVWTEERVCDGVNDYLHYLFGDSPVRRPEIALDDGPGGTGSYDDVVFEIWLARRWGDGLIRDYWRRRVDFRDEPPLETWDALLTARGASLTAAWGEFIGWNYVTGTRALPGVGYPDAARFPMSEPAVTLSEFPAVLYGAIDHLAAGPVRLAGLETLGDRLLAVEFKGADLPSPLALSVYARLDDGSGWLDTVGLDRQGHARLVLPAPAGRLHEVGLVIGNGSLDGPARLFTLAVDTLAGAVTAPAGVVTGIEPNPCNASTWLSCQLSARAEATLDVLDAGGRRLRRLWGGSLGPGSHRFEWDGRGDDGRPAPAGVYLAYLRAGSSANCRKLTLVR
jgi:hypothetical protein